MNMHKGFPRPNLSNEIIVESIETCAICGGKLKFHHITNYMALKVDEEAKCADCGIKSGMNSFSLQ